MYSLIKDQPNLHNSKIEKANVCFAYDRRWIPSENWVGVVIRNLPTNLAPEKLLSNLKLKCPNIHISIESIKMIRNQYCAQVRVKHIEEAELLAKTWNYFLINDNKYMKVHIHPLSNY